MSVEKATVFLTLKRLVTARSTYKLVGAALLVTGVANGTMVMGLVEQAVCALVTCT